MKNAQFEIDIKEVPNIFNKLTIVDREGEQLLEGELDIIDRTGRLWDTYKVEISGSYGYPYAFPKLFEAGNAFPKIADWHVYNDEKSCCVDVTPNEKILCKDGIHIVEYIKRFAIPYFANQTYRKREGYYLYGEYAHGIFGRIEFYQKKLKARNPAELIQMFELILKDYNPDRTAYCPICKKEKFRNCHKEVFKELRDIKEFLYNDRLQLIPFFNSNPDYKLPN
jgi:hypothetical protein